MINYIDGEKCTGCGTCFKSCSLDVFRINTDQQGLSPCMAACPAGIDVRGYNALLQQGMMREALELLKSAMPFPAITGRVCFHPCETECGRAKVDESVNINALEQFLGDMDLARANTPGISVTHLAKVAVVGSGPAGLACAWFMALSGYKVTVYEAMPQPGGMLRYGIPAHRLPDAVVEAQVAKLKELGVEFICNIKVGVGCDLTLAELLRRGYAAVLAAPGCSLGKKVPLEGSNLPGVYSGLEFLRAIRNGEETKIGKRVAVIGGGNVAIDAAISAKRLGAAQVELFCLEDEASMPAFAHNVEDARAEGIGINPSWGPCCINGANGCASGISFKRCLSLFDKEGRFAPSYNDAETTKLDVDNVIFAIGQGSELEVFSDLINLNDRGQIVADSPGLTSDPRIFAAGDAVSGPASVVQAIAGGREAAKRMHSFLTGRDPVREDQRPLAENLPGENIPKLPRTERRALQAPGAKGFAEQRGGFDLEEALGEAMRCMTCGGKAYIAYPDDCMTCYSCELRCPSNAVNVHPFKEILPRTLERQCEVKK